jgi:glycosyltransferase involved in cell wall biosynthesis
MRICYISYKFYPAIGGAERRAEKQARQLQSLGHEVTIITLRLKKNWKQVELLDGLPVIRIGGIYRRNGQLRIGKFWQLPIGIGILLTLWQKRHQYDIIHAFQIAPSSVPAVLFSHLIHKPIVLSMQNTGPYESKLAPLQRLEDGSLVSRYGLLIDWKEDWAIQASDLTLLPQIMLGGYLFLKLLRKSHAFYQALSTRCYSYFVAQGFPAERITVIPGSIDTEKFCPVLQRTLEYTAVERKIICVARLEYSKGIDVLLHAWAELMRTFFERKNEMKPTLHLVGDGKFRKQLERMATELSIEDSVQFLGNRRDIVLLLQQSWGFVLSSRWEGMPNALLEAMACGIPCVATRVSGSEDIISDGINGLLVEPEQPDAMAQALRRIIEDVLFAQRLGQEGRATVVRDYQLSAVVEQCLELYRCVLERGIDN